MSADRHPDPGATSADSEEQADFEPLDWVFGVLLALHLALVILIPHVPVQDMPVHLASSAAVGGFLRGDAELVVERYYQLQPVGSPTWGVHLLLALLQQVLAPGWAEKVALVLYLLALPLSARTLLRSACRNPWRALAFLPLLMNFPFHTGLLSYCLSLPLFLWLLALWLPDRPADEFQRGWLIRSVAVASLLVVAHPVTWVVAAVALSCVVAHRAWREAGTGRFAWPEQRHRLLELGVTLAPGAVLVATFAAGQSGGSERWPWAVIWRSLLTLNSLVSFDRGEVFWTMAWGLVLVSATFWLLVRRRLRSRRRSGDVAQDGRRFDALLWATAATVALYFVSPDATAGGSLITPRLGLSCWLLLTAWLVTQPWTHSMRTLIAAAAAGVAFALLALHAASYLRLQSGYDEVWGVASCMEPQRTLLPLVFNTRGRDEDGEPLSIKVRPFVSIGSRLAVERGLVDLNNYQAASGYFPIVFRPDVDPSRWLWRDVSGIRRLDLDGYHRNSAGRVDYVLLWGYHPGVRSFRRDLSRLPRDLAASYDLVHESASGQVLLFARRDLHTEAACGRATESGVER